MVFSKFSLFNKGIIIIFVSLTVYFGYRFVNNLQKNNIELNKQIYIAKQELENNKIKIDFLVKQVDDTTRFYKQLNIFDREYTQSIIENNKKIEKLNESKRLSSLLESRKSTLMLSLINKQSKCQWENFFNFDVECKQGEVK